MGVGEKAPPGGGRDGGKSQAGGQRELGLAGSPRPAEKLFPVDCPVPFRKSLGKKAGREGAENKSLHPGIGIDGDDGTLFLGHGPLAQDLAGHQKGGPHLFHEGAPHAKHVDPAVDTGVHGTSIAIAGMAQHVEKGLPLGSHHQGNPDLLRHRLRHRIAPEGAFEVKGNELDPHAPEKEARQSGVEPSRQEKNAFRHARPYP